MHLMICWKIEEKNTLLIQINIPCSSRTLRKTPATYIDLQRISFMDYFHLNGLILNTLKNIQNSVISNSAYHVAFFFWLCFGKSCRVVLAILEQLIPLNATRDKNNMLIMSLMQLLGVDCVWRFYIVHVRHSFSPVCI